jgi:hypothetical protein
LALQSGARQLKNTPFPLRIPLRRAYLEERGKNMKKLLLATSILAGTAGLAAAEITLSGDARMGFLDDFVYDGGDDDIGFTSRARVTFTFSGETDGGLSFGASFRADNSSNARTAPPARCSCRALSARSPWATLTALPSLPSVTLMASASPAWATATNRPSSATAVWTMTT